MKGIAAEALHTFQKVFRKAVSAAHHAIPPVVLQDGPQGTPERRTITITPPAALEEIARYKPLLLTKDGRVPDISRDYISARVASLRRVAHLPAGGVRS